MEHAAKGTRLVMCIHYACRCARAAELAIMAERTGRTSLLLDAIAVHDQEVTCRNDQEVTLPSSSQPENRK